MAKTCIVCGKKAMSDYCFAHKRKKPIKQAGAKTELYNIWRDTIAKPYLDKKYGHVCSACKGKLCGNKQLDVDHILKRGSHPELKMALSNVQYLGRYPCHWEKDNT